MSTGTGIGTDYHSYNCADDDDDDNTARNGAARPAPSGTGFYQQQTLQMQDGLWVCRSDDGGVQQTGISNCKRCCRCDPTTITGRTSATGTTTATPSSSASSSSCCNARCGVITVNSARAFGWTIGLLWILLVPRIERYLQDQVSRASYFNTGSSTGSSNQYYHRSTSNSNEVDQPENEGDDWSVSVWTQYFYNYFYYDMDQGDTNYDSNASTTYYYSSNFDEWIRGSGGGSYYNGTYFISDDDPWWWWPFSDHDANVAMSSPSLTQQCIRPLIHIGSSLLGIVGAIHAHFFLVGAAALDLVWTLAVEGLWHGNGVALFGAIVCLVPHVILMHQLFPSVASTVYLPPGQ